MKKYMIIVLLALPTFLLGQTTTENYVKNTTYLVPTQNGDQNNVQTLQKIEGVSYYDGLGRLNQSVTQRAGSDNQDIITIQEYDGLGRNPKQYLPLPISSADGTYRTGNIQNEINTYYSSKYPQDAISSGVINAYSEMAYDGSWENRPLEQAAPGADWLLNPNSDTDHTIKTEYGANTRTSFTGGSGTSADDVVIFKVDYIADDLNSPSLVYDGIFDADMLRKVTVKDENWTPSSGNNHTTQTFTNDRGQVLLKRTFVDGIALDTYYVYDRYNNLSYVLSPEGSAAIISGTTASITEEKLEQWCYQYKYDYRHRLTHKRVPGKGWEYIVYDKLDRPVLTQDARMRENNQWLFAKYDAFNRPVYTGLYQPSIGADFTSVQNAINAQSNVHESRTSNSNAIGGGNAYYSNTVFPTTSITLHSVSYFDSYIDHAGIALPSSVYNQNLITTVKSLPTVSKIRVLETNDWITSITGYDYKRRPIFGSTVNTYLDTEDTSESLLDFTGKVLESRTTHQKANQPTIVTKDYFTYDHQQRLLTQMQQIDNEPLQLIVSNTYDEIGQLVSKHVGGQLFESGYTDLIGVSVSTDGSVITKTGTTNGFNAGLSTVGKLEGNGGISFNALTPGAEVHIGFNDVSTNAGGYDMNYYFRLENSANGPRYRAYRRALAGGGSTQLAYGLYDLSSNSFAIERVGDDIEFIHNGTVIATSSLEDSTIDLIGDVSIRTPNAQIGNYNFYATTIDKSLQKVDYAYNIRGWMTDINDVDAQSRDAKLFNFRINYNGAIEGASASQGVKPLYNGNISQTTWKTLSADPDQDKRSYGYQYDALNRLTNAYSYKGNTLTQQDKYGLEGVSYDKNGNINTLLRYGYTASATEVMDQLVYGYLGNQLQNVTDLSTHSIKREGFYDGNTTQNDDYEYDVNGNMIVDRNKGISNISYNHLNLPVSLSINTSSDAQGIPQQGTITYVYDATGAKLEKQVSKQSQLITYTRYAGGYIYEEENGTEKLKMFAHPEGYVEPVAGTSKSIGKFNSLSGTSYSSYLYAFNYTDHLGNVRLTYADSDGDGAIEQRSEVISEKHYYPFGLKHQGYNNTVTSNANSMAEKFAFGGNELGEELGLDWYDISARNYDPALARWMNIDPLADQMRRHSPYNYAFDNPIFFIDPDGMAPVVNWGAQTEASAIAEAEVDFEYNSTSSNSNRNEESKEEENTSPDDVVKVNSKGEVISVKSQEGDHVVVDESGNELDLNDNDFDQDQLDYIVELYKAYGQAKLFTLLTKESVNSIFEEKEINSIITNYTRMKNSKWLGPMFALNEMIYLAYLGHGAFDFSGDMSRIARENGTWSGGGAYAPDGDGGFIRFEGSNTLYNIYDAGNFMTGRGFKFLGLSLKSSLEGADINSRGSFDGPDTDADQRAITNGYNYKL